MKLYSYSGSISQMSEEPGRNVKTLDIIIYDINDNEKAPTRLQAFGALAKYIDDIEGTDAEERYINCNWYYDSNLFLRYIEVPSSNPFVPAKVITSSDFLSNDLIVFGPTNYIEVSDPEPMDGTDDANWCSFRASLRTSH